MWSLQLIINKLMKTDEEHFQGSDGLCFDGLLPHSHTVEVPHVNQEFYWDCGLACVKMVLKTVGVNNCSVQELLELCCTTSIWTVDLAYLLHKLSVEFSYFTVTIGANPYFSVEAFYKEQLPDDIVRVDMLFRNASNVGIDIQRRSVSLHEISLFILSGKYIAIMLVDQNKLRRSWLEDLCVSGFHDDNIDYTGHYVVVCGYDAVNDEFEIRDPASAEKHLRVRLKCLEEARKSFGTDEDLLLGILSHPKLRLCHNDPVAPGAPSAFKNTGNGND